MHKTTRARMSGVFSCLAIAGLLGLAACGVTQPAPTAQSVAGMTPTGRVTMTEVVAAGATGGTGTLTFQGRTHPFRLVGSVIGPGGASQIQASGEVYGLNSLSDFEGVYTESSGPAGLAMSGRADLWMRNKYGVIMHLTGTSQGVVLSLGRSEVLVKLAN